MVYIPGLSQVRKPFYNYYSRISRYSFFSLAKFSTSLLRMNLIHNVSEFSPLTGLWIVTRPNWSVCVQVYWGPPWPVATAPHSWWISQLHTGHCETYPGPGPAHNPPCQHTLILDRIFIVDKPMKALEKWTVIFSSYGLVSAVERKSKGPKLGVVGSGLPCLRPDIGCS